MTSKYTDIYEQEKFPHSKKLEEVDLYMLLKAFWADRFIIVFLLLVFSVAAALFAYNKPDTYETRVTFFTADKFYAAWGVSEPKLSPQLLSSAGFKSKIASIEGVDPRILNDISISLDNRNKLITIYKSSTNPEAAYLGVDIVARHLNSALKQNEMGNVYQALTAAKSLENHTFLDKAQETLSELYSRQLFKKAILESPTSNIVHSMTPPRKPTSPIKPKRTIIITLGSLIGLLFGLSISVIKLIYKLNKHKTNRDDI
ncbi:Wzz/FepE/Etk N-terminal domain-containing protein [uncultured Vibrio sp.]|uniref:Wzz/FepE/Etk N-terminal domain-containing protein n=1 Tax=uncultured Vibrio sp. TaxID=114054 RepID=UPI00091D4DB5|nr:Wzz/FepE/Etk N-terminal domain-containing protein [uncultured Vibrio sp.]OIQ25329.1 MAG: hypothetical protein BM561_06065 [Vibrio sp. MedPE-SWchi]